MKRIKKFLVSFIPRYVGNRTFLKMYQVLTVIPVSRKTRDQNYNTNIVQLKNKRWDFWTVHSSYIENQNEWGNIMYGAGKYHNMMRSGCEVIATFNALKTLTGTGSPESMAELIREFEAHGAALRGEFGTSPRAVEAYFRKHGFQVTTTAKGDGASLETVDRQSQVLIAVAYNNANDITRQIHTMCITKEAGKGYILHNAYYRDKNGKYIASAPYASLSDAISNMSRHEPKLIYLIGISGSVF